MAEQFDCVLANAGHLRSAGDGRNFMRPVVIAALRKCMRRRGCEVARKRDVETTLE